MFHARNSSLSSERNHEKHVLLCQCLVDPPVGGRVDTIVEKKQINARWPCQMEPKQSDSRGDTNLTTLLVAKQKVMHEYKQGQGRPT